MFQQQHSAKSSGGAQHLRSPCLCCVVLGVAVSVLGLACKVTEVLMMIHSAHEGECAHEDVLCKVTCSWCRVKYALVRAARSETHPLPASGRSR